MFYKIIKTACFLVVQCYGAYDIAIRLQGNNLRVLEWPSVLRETINCGRGKCKASRGNKTFTKHPYHIWTYYIAGGKGW